MDNLPVEIVLMILERTPGPSILNCLRASRRLRTIVHNQPSFWKKHYRFGYGEHGRRTSDLSAIAVEQDHNSESPGQRFETHEEMTSGPSRSAFPTIQRSQRDEKENEKYWMRQSLLSDYWYEGICHFYYDYHLAVNENSYTQCCAGWSFTVELELSETDRLRFRDGVLRLTCRPLRQHDLRKSKLVFEWTAQDLPERLEPLSVLVEADCSNHGRVLLAISAPSVPQFHLLFDVNRQQILEFDNNQFEQTIDMPVEQAHSVDVEDQIEGFHGYESDARGNIWALDAEEWPYHWPNRAAIETGGREKKSTGFIPKTVRTKPRWMTVSSATENPKEDSELSKMYIDEAQVVVLDHLPVRRGRRHLQFRVYDFLAAAEWDLKSWTQFEEEIEKKEALLLQRQRRENSIGSGYSRHKL